MSRILFVEDSEDIQVFLAGALRGLDCRIEKAYCVEDAKRAIANAEREPLDLAILDLSLPDGDAFEVMREIRSKSWTKSVPVLFFSGMGDVDTKLSAFDQGADDYLVKPIDPRELKARVALRLKKEPSAAPSNEVRTGGFALRLAELSFVSHETGEKIELTGKEFKILSVLMQNPGQIFTRQQLVKKVWGESVHVLDRTVDSHVCGIRRRLGKYADSLESRPNEGYCWQVDSK